MVVMWQRFAFCCTCRTRIERFAAVLHASMHAPPALALRKKVACTAGSCHGCVSRLTCFLPTGAALRDSAGKFRGMLLERLSGRCVDKLICTPGFADVTYIHDMLKSVFTALERAQSWLGAPAWTSAPVPAIFIGAFGLWLAPLSFADDKAWLYTPPEICCKLTHTCLSHWHHPHMSRPTLDRVSLVHHRSY